MPPRRAIALFRFVIRVPDSSRRGIFLLLALSLAATPVAAQPEPGGRPGLLRELRSRLSFRPASEVWQNARGDPSAERALPLMEELARRTNDPEYALKAALWLGHYYYGMGQVDLAKGYFERGLAKPGAQEDHAEAAFWVSQCRNLLGEREPTEERTGGRGLHGVLEAMSRHDDELRAGDLSRALQGYLSLEGEARQAGCVGPLLYRLGLVISAGMERGVHPPVGWDLVRRWESSAPASPERALVEVMAPGSIRAPAAQADTAGAGSGGTTLPFVEEGSGEKTSPAADTAASLPPAESSPAPAPPQESSAPAASGAYAVQLGAFIDRDRAGRELERITARGVPARMDVEVMNGSRYYKIRLVERGDTRKEAEDLAHRLCSGLDWQIVRIAP